MLTQQCHPDRAKRRGISNNGIRDVSTTVDMTPTWFFSIWLNCYIVISLPKFFNDNCAVNAELGYVVGSFFMAGVTYKF